MVFLILTSIMCNSDSEWFKCFVKGNLWLLCSLDVMPILAVQRSVHHLLLLFVSNVCAGFKSCSSYNLPTQVKDVFFKDFIRFLYSIHCLGHLLNCSFTIFFCFSSVKVFRSMQVVSWSFPLGSF
jgi:hypothetical protein